jgi:hypothetical protein
MKINNKIWLKDKIKKNYMIKKYYSKKSKKYNLLIDIFIIIVLC